MSDWLNNTNKQYLAATEALYKLGRREPTPYHLPRTDHAGRIIEARPDIQSEARYNSIMARTKAVNAAIAAIEAEMVYSLQPADKRED